MSLSTITYFVSGSQTFENIDLELKKKIKEY